MRVDSTSSVDLSQFPLERSETKTHVGRLPVWQDLNGTLIDRSGGGETEVGGSLGDVDGEHLARSNERQETGCMKYGYVRWTDLHLVIILHSGSSTVVDPHSSLGETMLLFQLGVHQEDGLAEFLRTLFQSLFKQISCSFQLRASLKCHSTRKRQSKPFILRVRWFKGLTYRETNFDK